MASAALVAGIRTKACCGVGKLSAALPFVARKLVIYLTIASFLTKIYDI